MKDGRNNTIMLTIIAIATLLIAVVGATFAYFSAVLTGNESSNTFVIESGSVGTVFEGGTVINIDNIYPRADKWATKTFSIASAANAASSVNYSSSLIIDSCSFKLGSLKYKLLQVLADKCSNPKYTNQTECTANEGTWTKASTGGGTKMLEVTALQNIPINGSVVLGNGVLPSNSGTVDTHTYDLEVYFPDDGTIQNSEMTKILQAHISLDTIE